MTLTLDQFNAGRAAASMAERARYVIEISFMGDLCRIYEIGIGCRKIIENRLNNANSILFIERRAQAAGDKYAADNAKDCAEVSQAISYSHEMSEPGRVFQTLAEA